MGLRQIDSVLSIRLSWPQGGSKFCTHRPLYAHIARHKNYQIRHNKQHVEGKNRGCGIEILSYPFSSLTLLVGDISDFGRGMHSTECPSSFIASVKEVMFSPVSVRLSVNRITKGIPVKSYLKLIEHLDIIQDLSIRCWVTLRQGQGH